VNVCFWSERTNIGVGALENVLNMAETFIVHLI